MGSIAYRSYATDTTGGTTLTIAVPTGTVEGDMMVAFLASDNANASGFWTPPSGWAELVDEKHSGTNLQIGLMWKEAGGSEPASYDFVGTSTASAGQVLTFSNDGAAWDTPVASTVNHNTSTSNQTGALTADTNDAIVAGWANDGGQAQTTDPSGMTNTENLIYAVTLGLDVWYITGLSSGSKQYTNTYDTSDQISSVAVLLSDAAAAASTPIHFRRHVGFSYG